MAIALNDFYIRLEPNHEVTVDDEVQRVRCPFIDAETTWSLSAGPDEVDCAFCEYLHLTEEHPDLELPDCPHEGDGEAPIAGGAHGGTHAWNQWGSCAVPLRRITVFDVSLTVHEGIVADCYEAERRWRALGGPNWYVIRQHDTGSYNCRNSVGHSRAIAIDFNWQSNPYRKPRPSGGCPQDSRIREFWDRCLKPLGYGWGGNWNSACDAMHISKVPNEGGDGVLYRTWDVSPPAPTDTQRPVLRLQTPRMNGPYVVELQERLNALGHNAGKADGVFGPQTDAAAKRFQSAEGLKVDGIVGPQTWSALLADEEDTVDGRLTKENKGAEGSVTIPVARREELWVAAEHGPAQVRVVIGGPHPKWRVIREPQRIEHGDAVKFDLQPSDRIINLEWVSGVSVGYSVR